MTFRAPKPWGRGFATMRKHLVPDVVALLIVALIAGSAYLFVRSPPADVTVAPEPGCDLHRAACTARLPDGSSMELSILPRPIPLLATLQVEVRLASLAAERAEFDLAGAEMAMAPNRTQLVRAAPGIYRGTTTLPVCVTGKMKWQATVILETESRRIAIPFSFVSG